MMSILKPERIMFKLGLSEGVPMAVKKVGTKVKV